MTTKTRWIIGISVFFGALLLGAGIWAVEQYYRLEVCNYESLDGESHGYYVTPDMTADSLLHLMQQDYHIGSLTDWRLHKRYMLYLKPTVGYYRFPARIGDKHLIRRLQMGIESPVRITWTNSVRDNAQLASVLSKQLLLDSVTIKEKLDSDKAMNKYGFNSQTAVCMFLPDTYEVYWTWSADQLFDRMQSEYDRFWSDERLHKADSMALTPVQVATLASIVESESNKTAEYPLIASLYLNRLRKGMLLQACPTVIFATGNYKMRRVLKRHLAIESPYNTYKNIGLPPGPIRCAKGTTIDAVLNAPKTNYLYMCANPDFSGTHIFSAHYSQHAATARLYQQELNERQIQ
ncbi:MAG: endolytic transglycosylase MltG [Paludibacteraceae bacterium]|nr:endolytic transglycosylase MltG [Paludibacteraceae bacterium]